jgi:myosin heavy subunit
LWIQAFGNAKTVLNNNSSRFGKYIEILYHNDKLVGAQIRKYLLEKSRVVHQGAGECTFHALYYFAAGCAPARRLAAKLEPVSSYR